MQSVHIWLYQHYTVCYVYNHMRFSTFKSTDTEMLDNSISCGEFLLFFHLSTSTCVIVSKGFQLQACVTRSQSCFFFLLFPLLQSPHSSLFAIDINSGVLRIKSGQMLDYEKTKTHFVTVIAKVQVLSRIFISDLHFNSFLTG